MGQYDPYTYGALNTAGIPQAYSQGLENLGFVGTPFAGVQQTFEDQIKYQQVLKNILDQQLGAFGQGNNTAALPFNLRNMFNSAQTVLTDPMYGIIGAPGMFGNGYRMGALPNNMSTAETGWWNAAHGYPGVAAPNPVSAVGAGPVNNSIGTSAGPSNSGQSIAQLAAANPQSSGPGGSYAAYRQQQSDIGTHQGIDASGNPYTINKPYGQMNPQEQDAANRFAHQMSG